MCCFEDYLYNEARKTQNTRKDFLKNAKRIGTMCLQEGLSLINTFASFASFALTNCCWAVTNFVRKHKKTLEVADRAIGVLLVLAL